MALKFLNNGYFAGKVGIGTANPSSNLDIEDASGVTIDINSSSGDGQFRFQDNGTTKWSVGRDNTQQNFVFSNSSGLNSDNVLTLEHATGNVGIGTDSPGRTLDVAGRGRFVDSTATVDILSSIYIPLLITNTGGYAHARINGFEVGGTTTATNEGYIKTSDNSRRLSLDTNGWLFKTNSTELMRLTSLGNVGIGTTNPGSTLPTDSETTTKTLQLTGVSGSAGDTAVLLRSSDNSSGLDLWHNASSGDSYIDNRFNANQGDIIFRVKTAGTPLEALRITGNTNVGIGTTTPTQKLHVEGNARVTGAYYDSNNSPGTANQVLVSTATGTDWVDGSGSGIIGGPYLPLTGGTLSGNLTITKSSAMMKVSEAGGGDIRMVAGGSTGYIGTYNNTSMQIMQNGSNAIFIDTSKNIGIGTTLPDAKLSVTSTTINSEDIIYLKSGADNVNDYLGIAWELGVGGNGPHSAIRSFAGPSGSDARLGFLTTSDGGTTLTEGLSIAHDGNVGIGTTSPTEKLEVNGSIKVSNAYPRIYLADTQGVPRTFSIGTSNEDLIINSGSTDVLSILGASGNVGIGTTSPDYKLQVNGTIAPEGNEVNNLGSSTNRFNQLWAKLIYDINNGRGLNNQVLTSTGSGGISWADASTVIGGPYLPLTGGTLTGALNGTSATFSGDVTIAKSTPKLTFNNLAGGGLDPSLTASGTNFTVSTSSITPLSIALDTGDATFAGNVLINKASNPTSLQIGSNLADDPFIVFQSDGNTMSMGIDRSDSNKFVISDNATLGTNNRLTIDTSGVATFGNIVKSTRFTSTTASGLHFSNYTGSQGWQIGADSTAAGMYIYNENGVYAMKLTSGGNATFAGNATVNGGQLYVQNAVNPLIYLNDTNAGAGIFQQEGNTTRIGSDSNTQVVLVQNNATAVTIDTDKNVGINTTSPDFKLDVDGTFGVSDLPFNTDSVSVLVADETIGADLVTNGDFATNTDWTEQGGAAAWSIANGKANCVVNSVTRYFEQPNVLPSSGPGYTYKVIYTISGITQGDFRINIGGYGATPGRTANGTYAETFTTTHASSNNGIYLQSSPNTIGSIDNISVQLVTSASNQIQKRELGTGAFANIGDYLPLAGGTMTGNIKLEDDVQLRVGTDSDLRIYNNGASSNILNTVGNLNIRNTADDGNINFQSDDGTGGYDNYFIIDGGNTQTQVYRDFRFQDTIKAKFGNGSDLQIYHDGSNSFIQDVGAGMLAIDTNGTDVRITKTDSEFMAKFVTDAEVQLYYNGSKKFETTNTGVEVTGNIDLPSNGAILFDNTNNTEQYYIRNGGGSQSSFQIGKGNPGSDIKLAIDDNGNVGIGTTSPERKLHINSGATNEAVRIESTDTEVALELKDSTGTAVIRSRGDFRFDGSSGEIMRMEAGGNVGIGTTGPSATLEVVSSQTNSGIKTGGLEMQSYAVNNSWYAENLYYDGGWKLRNDGYATQMYMQMGEISFRRVSSLGSAGDSVSPDITMLLASNGNVGIGATSPGAKLQVGTRGTAGALTPPATDGILFDFHNDGNPYTRHAAIISQASDATESVIDFWTKVASGTSAKKMTIRGNGDVGIGTTDPKSKLEVDGGVKIGDDTDTASANKVGTLRYRTSGNNSYVDMCMQTGATTYAWINIVQNNW